MKRLFAIFSLALLILLTSCSGLSEKTGSVTFSITNKQLEKFLLNTSASRSIDSDDRAGFIFASETDSPIDEKSDDTEDDYDYDSDILDFEEILTSDFVSLKFEVSISGDWEGTRQISFSKKELRMNADLDEEAGKEIVKTATFDGIPVGSVVKATAKLSVVYKLVGVTISKTYAEGTSDSLTIAAGTNKLDLYMHIDIDDEDETAGYPFTVTMQYEEGKTVPSGDISYLYVYAVEADSDLAERILSMAPQDGSAPLIAQSLSGAIMVGYYVSNPSAEAINNTELTVSDDGTLTLSGYTNYKEETGYGVQAGKEYYFFANVFYDNGKESTIAAFGHPVVDVDSSDIAELAKHTVSSTENNISLELVPYDTTLRYRAVYYVESEESETGYEVQDESPVFESVEEIRASTLKVIKKAMLVGYDYNEELSSSEKTKYDSENKCYVYEIYFDKVEGSTYEGRSSSEDYKDYKFFLNLYENNFYSIGCEIEEETTTIVAGSYKRYESEDSSSVEINCFELYAHDEETDDFVDIERKDVTKWSYKFTLKATEDGNYTIEHTKIYTVQNIEIEFGEEEDTYEVSLKVCVQNGSGYEVVYQDINSTLSEKSYSDYVSMLKGYEFEWLSKAGYVLNETRTSALEFNEDDSVYSGEYYFDKKETRELVQRLEGSATYDNGKQPVTMDVTLAIYEDGSYEVFTNDEQEVICTISAGSWEIPSDENLHITEYVTWNPLNYSFALLDGSKTTTVDYSGDMIITSEYGLSMVFKAEEPTKEYTISIEAYVETGITEESGKSYSPYNTYTSTINSEEVEKFMEDPTKIDLSFIGFVFNEDKSTEVSLDEENCLLTATYYFDRDQNLEVKKEYKARLAYDSSDSEKVPANLIIYENGLYEITVLDENENKTVLSAGKYEFYEETGILAVNENYYFDVENQKIVVVETTNRIDNNINDTMNIVSAAGYDVEIEAVRTYRIEFYLQKDISSSTEYELDEDSVLTGEYYESDYDGSKTAMTNRIAPVITEIKTLGFELNESKFESGVENNTYLEKYYFDRIVVNGSITVTLESIESDQTEVTLVYDPDTHSLTATGDFETYSWFIEGAKVEGASTNSYTVELSAYEPGSYSVSVAVTKTVDGEVKYYSAQATFSVTQTN